MPGEALIRSLGGTGTGTPTSVDAALLERRSEARTSTNWIAMILLVDGTEIPCTVKDVSKSGARLGVPDTVVLPEIFQLKVLGYTFLFRVRLVWRSDHCTGVRIEQFGKTPPRVAPEESKAPAEPPETYTALRGQRWSRFSRF
jgi:hypothetical protein